MYTLSLENVGRCSRKILLNLKIYVSFRFCYLLFNHYYCYIIIIIIIIIIMHATERVKIEFRPVTKIGVFFFTNDNEPHLILEGFLQTCRLRPGWKFLSFTCENVSVLLTFYLVETLIIETLPKDGFNSLNGKWRFNELK